MPRPESRLDVDVSTLRGLGLIGGTAHALTAWGLWLGPPAGASASTRGWMTGASLAVALLFGFSSLAVAYWPVRRILLVLAWLTFVSVTTLAWWQGSGVQAPGLGFYGLVVCSVAAWCGGRAAGLLAAACAGGLVALAWHTPDALVLPAFLTHLLLLGGGLGIGLIMAASAKRAAGRVEAREEHMRGLLDMAADRYWEMDADLRLTRAGWVDAPGEGSMAAYVGQDPMQQAEQMYEPGVKEAQMADLKARRPFHDVRSSRRGPDGEVTHYAMSGRPRFAADGRFVGYSGVGRNVTLEAEARLALAASEARFRNLFERAPSALVVHRGGVVIDANPAAAAMFGFDSAAAMRGVALESLYVEAESLARLRQGVAQLESMSIGSTMPTADFQMRSVRGEVLSMQASGVRIDAEGGAATLSMYVDITARVKSETALRESQRVLETVFASNPDGIALTVMESGKYVLVNENFARMLGYRVDEVIGRTSAEIGLWTHPALRAALLAELLAHGALRESAAIVKTRSGRHMPVIWSSSRVELNGCSHLISNIRDVTQAERLRLEHGAVFRSAIVGIALTREEHFQLANPRFHEVFGWADGDLIGQPAMRLWPDAQAYQEVNGAGSQALAQGRPLRFERKMQRADGSLFWCRMQAQLVDLGDPLGGTVWVVEDITERRQLDAKLASARDAAEAATRAKSSFLANTSHEIRTPLNGMLGLARMAAQDELAPALRRQYLAQLVESTQSLAAIISDILDLSKIEAGRIDVESAPFDLHQLLSGLQATYRPTAAAAGLALSLEVGVDVPLNVLGDAMRLRQILTNFVTNALKFTPAGGVRICATALGGERVRFAVIDSGPGIAADVQQRLFTPFTQGDDSRTRRQGGTGLGLSICRELARLLGGTVGVGSSPGSGSEFWCELPLPQAEWSAAPPSGAAAVPEAQARDALAGLRVLVVEDNAVNMMVVGAMLGRWGVEVSEATEGELAITAVEDAAAAGRPFDIVLMDVQMPRMNGHDATRRLRLRWSAEALPIIALTAAALVAEREEALAAGMNDFLTKPVDAVKLFEALNRLHVRRLPR